MSGDALVWDINLRTNLVLWPSPAPNIAALAGKDGDLYDERAFLAGFPQGTDGRAPNDTRAVRNTFEAMALEGLAYRTGSPDVFTLTPLGRCAFSFLGAGQDRTFANAHSRRLLGEPLIRGLAAIEEYRAIWRLMRLAGNMLTNEELNRALNIMKASEDVEKAANAVLDAREGGDPTAIGPRLYHDDLYATDASEQRKAINPQFLIAGGGGIIINVDRNDEMRRLEDWAIPLLDRALATGTDGIHASTAADDVLRISAMAAVPPRLL